MSEQPVSGAYRNDRYCEFEIPSPVPTTRALAVVADLQGFSEFCTSPDTLRSIAPILNATFKSMGDIVQGGNPAWMPQPHAPWTAISQPSSFKFLGDGGLYLWAGGEYEALETGGHRLALIQRLWNLVVQFESEVASGFRAGTGVARIKIPKFIRFGLAMGDVGRLQLYPGRTEYSGYCINLASRLQGYFSVLGMVVSDRGVSNEEGKSLRRAGFTCLEAKDIKGHAKETVWAMGSSSPWFYSSCGLKVE